MAISTLSAGFRADLPIGVISPWPGVTAPPGWLLCAGQAVSRTEYAELFDVLGTAFGSGNGSTTFNLPDLRGRSWFGLDNLGGSDAGRLSVSNTLGGTGGAETHTLTTEQLPSHSHTVNHDHPAVNVTAAGGQLISHIGSEAPNWGLAAGGGAANRPIVLGGGGPFVAVNLPQFTGTSGSAGSGQAHNNMPPYMLGGWIIKARHVATRPSPWSPTTL